MRAGGLALLAALAWGCAPAQYPAGPYGFDTRNTVPDLRFESADALGAPTVVQLRDYFEPAASASRLLLLRVGAGWCGTCRWHLAHTGELLGLAVGSSVSLVDVLLADDDNLPASLSSLAAYRSRIDVPTTVVLDPEFQLAPTMFGREPLPLFVAVDRRTMTIQLASNNPDPDELERLLVVAFNRLNGTQLQRGASTDGPDGFHRNQWDLLRDMALPGAPPPDPTNAKADDPAAAELGRQLFSDTSLSPSGTVSCATCHDPAKSFADALPRSVGAQTGDRNAQSVIFASHSRWQFWDGRADSLWAQALAPFENPKEFASSRLFVAHAIFDRYQLPYENVFGRLPALADTARFPATGGPATAAWQGMAADDRDAVNRIFANVGKAIAAFERTLRAEPNALDRYIAGDLNALDDEQKLSLRQFFVGGCVQCHYGPRLTDDAFHVLRFPTGRLDGLADAGRDDGIAPLLASEFLGTGPYSDAPASARSFTALARTANMRGAFKTPTLRGVADSAPYGHGGTLATLLDVAKLYGTAGLGEEDPAATGRSEPWVTMFVPSHAPELVPFLQLLTAKPIP